MKRTRNSLTIRDVAEACEVSISTVSRVLNDKADVSAETYDKVRRVIAEMGYTSSLAATSMRSREHGMRPAIKNTIRPDRIDRVFTVDQRGMLLTQKPKPRSK